MNGGDIAAAPAAAAAASIILQLIVHTVDRTLRSSSNTQNCFVFFLEKSRTKTIYSFKISQVAFLFV